MAKPIDPKKNLSGLKRWQAVVGTLVGGVLAQGASFVFLVIGVLGLMAYHNSSNVNDIQKFPGAPIVFATSALTASVFLLVASFGTVWLAKVDMRHALGLVRAPVWTYPAAALGALGLGPIGSTLHEGVEKIAPNLTFGTIDFLNDFASSNTALIAFPLLAIMPAFSEEIFFRGMLQRALGKGTKAILLSGVVFAFFHLDPHHVVAVLPIGLYMAWLGARSESTFVPIVAHLTNNSIAVIALQLQDKIETTTEQSVPLWMLIPSTLATIASIAVVWYVTKTKRNEPLSTPSIYARFLARRHSPHS